MTILAKLNLAAGRKAKDSAAHSAAKEYFLTGIALLGEERWERRHDLALHLHTLVVESFFLSGDFESMEHHIAQVLAHARSPLESSPSTRSNTRRWSSGSATRRPSPTVWKSSRGWVSRSRGR